MANISKIKQKLTQFGPAPQRNESATFSARADAMVKHFLVHLDEQNIMSEEYNTTIDEINTRAADIDDKYDEIVEKHTDFVPKYNIFSEKYDDFTPKYNDTVKKHGEVVSHSNHVDSVKAQIDIDLERAKSFINDGNGGIIDDTKISEVSTLSSKKIAQELDKKMEQTDVYTRDQADNTFLKKAAANWLATEAFQKSSNGYMRLSNGFIIQWKKLTITTPIPPGQEPQHHEFVFPIAFPNVCIGGSVSTFSENGNGNVRGISFDTRNSFGGLGALTNNKAIAILKPYNGGSYSLEKCEIFMIAFGY